MTAPKEDGLDFDALFAGSYRRLARLLYRITGDFGRAEEVTSEAFWRLYAKLLMQYPTPTPLILMTNP